MTAEDPWAPVARPSAPGRPGADGQSETGGGAGLDGLFTEDPGSGTGGRGSSDEGLEAGLEAGLKTGLEAGLDSLFEPAGVEASEEGATAGAVSPAATVSGRAGAGAADEEPSDRAARKAGGRPADLKADEPEVTFAFGADQTLESTLSGGAEARRLARFAGSVPGSETPTTPIAEPAQAAQVKPAAQPAAGTGGVKPKRRLKEAAELAEAGRVELDMGTDTFTSDLQRGQDERERLWPTITTILSAIAAEPEITGEAAGWKLTRDHQQRQNARSRLEQLLGPVMRQEGINIGNPRDLKAVFDIVYDELVGAGPLGPLWRDDDVTEILVDSWDKISVEKNGQLILTPVRFRDREHANRIARDLASSVSDRALNISNPLVTAELDRARANFAYGPVVRTGLSISIRKFRPLLSMDSLLERGALDLEMRRLLEACVAARATILVSGGTGTGKTTMLNALSEAVPDSERVVTIEDSFELNLANLHVVSLQTKEKASSDDDTRVSLADLLVNSLRMRPDRIVVGEIREPSGARAMLQAASTGHDGTMTTIHANTAEAAVNDRLSDLQREATGAPDDVCRRAVATAIDLVVQVTRRRSVRYISDIAVVDRSMIHEGTIRPESIYTGEVGEDGRASFRHVGSIRPDTGLAVKLAVAGYDPAAWEVR